MKSIIKRFVTEEDGMEMVEWALVAIVIAIAGAAAFAGISAQLTKVGAEVVKKLPIAP